MISGSINIYYHQVDEKGVAKPNITVTGGSKYDKIKPGRLTNATPSKILHNPSIEDLLAAINK